MTDDPIPPVVPVAEAPDPADVYAARAPRPGDPKRKRALIIAAVLLGAVVVAVGIWALQPDDAPDYTVTQSTHDEPGIGVGHRRWGFGAAV